MTSLEDCNTENNIPANDNGKKKVAVDIDFKKNESVASLYIHLHTYFPTITND